MTWGDAAYAGDSRYVRDQLRDVMQSQAELSLPSSSMPLRWPGAVLTG